jgi:CRP/FNR family transcriptional regulator, cyclic AMP receptor protein
MPDTLAAFESIPTAPCRHDGALSTEEWQALAAGMFMSRLPAALVDAILARVRVWRLSSGEPILRIGQPVEHWLGLAAGSALVFTKVPHDAELQCTNWVPTSVWLNLYNPCALTVSDVEVRAEGTTTVVALHADDLALLCQRFPELSRELATANAGNLRRAMQVVMATQRASVKQRQLFWLLEQAREPESLNDGRGHQTMLRLSHEALARWHGVSRQAWCEGMKHLEEEGLVRRVGSSLVVPDRSALERAIQAETVLVEEPYKTLRRPEAFHGVQSVPAPCVSALHTLRASEFNRVCRGRWFRSLPPELRARVLELSGVRRIAAGEVVLRAGDWPQGCWLLVDGVIQLDNPHAQEPHRTIALLPPGAWHSHQDLVYGSANDVDAVALQASTLLWMPADDFHRLFNDSLDYRLAVTRLLALQQSQAGRYAVSFLWPIEVRVGIWLQMMHSYFDMTSGAGRSIAASFSMEAVAQWLGTTRQAVSRQLRMLESDGVIRRSRTEIELLQPQRLPQLI